MYIIYSNGEEKLLVNVPIKQKYWDDVALINLPKDLVVFNKFSWQLVDIPTGLCICSGKTKKECIENFEKNFKERYLNYKSNNAYYYRQKTELQDLIKAHEEGGKKDG